MSKLEKLCAGIVAISAVLWLLSDRHHSLTALAALDAEVTQVERSIRAGEADAQSRQEALLATLRETRLRWIQEDVAKLETRLTKSH